MDSLRLMENPSTFPVTDLEAKGSWTSGYSERNEDGKWGEPVNCGNIINTPYNEDTPFFDPETGALIVQFNRTYKHGRI